MKKKVLNPREARHLYWRAGFGMPLTKWNRTEYDLQTEIDAILLPCKSFLEITTIKDGGKAEMEMMKNPMMASGERGKDQSAIFPKQFDISFDFFQLIPLSENSFREKMTLFWLNLFSCQPGSLIGSQYFLNTIRKNAVGNFKDLLLAVVKHPTMMHYLSVKLNRKEMPNENLARELFELFTLGRGNYSETDVKEASRALTGWSYSNNEFHYESDFHDNGQKVILGKTGNFNGDDLIEIILENEQCAYYVTERICKDFINPKISQAVVKEHAKVFFESGYDIVTLMTNIFTSADFYNDENIGIKIKSPYDLLAGIVLVSKLRINDSHTFNDLQRALGQEIFRPPNVAGWATGTGWINNSSLIARMGLALRLFKYPKLSERVDTVEATVAKTKLKNNHTKFISNWKDFEACFDNFTPSDMYIKILSFLIQADITKIDLSQIFAEFDQQLTPYEIAVEVMGLPEYQLC